MLSEETLEELRKRSGKIGVIAYAGHEVVFRRPTRDECREYRRMQSSPQEKSDAIERLAQVTLVAFDGDLDVNRARTAYTGVFLEEYPLFASNPKVMGVLSVLSGVVEEEDAADLGKGACVRSGRPKSTQGASPNGSPTAPAEQS